jgi:NADH:ubiquinone oxidoreductase subunit 3 (subunit A)
MNSQQVQQAIILIGVVLLITLCTVFSQAAFSDLSLEAGGGTTYNASADASTYNAGQQTHSYIYVIGLLLIIAAVIVAFQILKNRAQT